MNDWNLFLWLVVHACGGDNCKIEQINDRFSMVQVCNFLPAKAPLLEHLKMRDHEYEIIIANDCG